MKRVDADASARHPIGVKVRVARQGIAADQSVSGAAHTHAGLDAHAARHSLQSSGRPRVVELMASKRGADGVEGIKRIHPQ